MSNLQVINTVFSLTHTHICVTCRVCGLLYPSANQIDIHQMEKGFLSVSLPHSSLHHRQKVYQCGLKTERIHPKHEASMCWHVAPIDGFVFSVSPAPHHQAATAQRRIHCTRNGPQVLQSSSAAHIQLPFLRSWIC